MSAGDKPGVIVVEDERLVAWDLQEMVTSFGYDCYAVASSAAEALSAAARRRPDLVLMDIRLRGPTDGVEAARLLQQEHGLGVQIVFLSAHGSRDLGARAGSVSASAWLRKPISPRALRETLERVLGPKRSEPAG